jgi:hypothetical protein
MFLNEEVVDNISTYYKKLGIGIEKLDWDETNEEGLVPIEEMNAIGEILSCQVAFWGLRRIGRMCGSNCDIMMRIIRQKIDFYEKTFGKEFHNFNSEVIWK